MLLLVLVVPAVGKWCYSYVVTRGLPFWRSQLTSMDRQLNTLLSDRRRQKSEKEAEKEKLEDWLKVLENRWRIEIANRTKEMEARRDEVEWAMKRSKADFEQDEDKLKYEIEQLQKEKDRLEDEIESRRKALADLNVRGAEKMASISKELDDRENHRKAERLTLEKRADEVESQVIKTQIRNRDLRKNMTRLQTIKKCKKKGSK